MNISISAKNTELDEELKGYIKERVGRVQKYVDYKINVAVYLGMEKHRHQSHITVKGKKLYLNSEAEDVSSIRKAVDKCVDKLEKQLRRGKEGYQDEKLVKESLKENYDS